jgi:hypothetical protein
MSKNDWCRHFRDLTKNADCRAGVVYKIIAPKPLAGEGGLPCWGVKPGTVLCEYREGYTADEIAEQEDWLRQRMNDMGTVLRAIDAEHKASQSWAGEMPCPICKTGRLRWTKARYNGHVHAGCSTPDCISFMQ